MGCFGDMEPTKSVDSTQTSAPPQWVQDAGQQNYNAAKGVMDAGFQPYTGQFVAPLSDKEKQAGDLVSGLASSGNPYTADAESSARLYGSAPATKYNFNTVVDPNGPLGPIQNYIDPYLQSVLDPSLRAISLQGAKDRQNINANATTAGAFGDARHGVVESEQRKNEGTQVADTTGKAWSDAFMSALQNRQTDAARQFSTQQAQNAADTDKLNRARTSGIDLTNLDKYNVSRGLGLASALGATGATERDVAQRTDDANYAEAMRKQGFTDNQVAFLTSILKGTPTAQTTTGNQTTSQPNNTGYQMLGTLASAMFL